MCVVAITTSVAAKSRLGGFGIKGRLAQIHGVTLRNLLKKISLATYREPVTSRAQVYIPVHRRSPINY